MSRARRQVPVLAVIAGGGVLGSLARYGVGVLTGETTWPWPILLVNGSGCLLIGSLMAVLLDLTAPHRLLRPFLGIGVLGGYTTFSTYAVDVQRLLVEGREVAALTYFLVTPVVALLAAWSGTAAARALLARRSRTRGVRI